MANTETKRGRKPKKDQEKVRVRPVYITQVEEKKILKKYKNLTTALKSAV